MLNPPKRLYIASDHAGVELKTALQSALADLPWEDLGPEGKESADYPDYADLLCGKILGDEQGTKNPKIHHTPNGSLGILICGSGIGMSIRANRFPHIRAALVERVETAKLAREHNHANVLCLGARDLTPSQASEIVKAWLSTTPSTDDRHLRRIRKLDRDC